MSAAVKSFPPRAPAVVDPNNPAIVNAPGYSTASQNPYYYGYTQQQTAQTIATNQQVAYQPQLQTAASKPDARALKPDMYGACGRSCYPHRVLSNSPCMCEKDRIGTVPRKFEFIQYIHYLPVK